MNSTIRKNYECNDLLIVFPKVSVIVATYRRKESLEKALLSLVNQSYDNLEIILVDDNADDVWNSDVKRIVEKIKIEDNIDIIYIQNSNNNGSAVTRNIGIKYATGDYITFLDDDDIYLRDKVRNQIEYMTTHKSDYSITDLWLYNENDRLIEKRSRNYIKDFSAESLLKYHLLYHMTGTDVMMFKKSYLLDIGMFSPINIGDEFYLMQKAIEGKGCFSYLPGCDVKAYIHFETNGLSSGDGKIKGENELYEYKQKFFKKLSVKEQRYISMRHYAVLGYAELRRRDYLKFINYSLKSFYSSPIQFFKIFFVRK